MSGGSGGMPFGQNMGVGQSALGQMQGGQMGQQPQMAQQMPPQMAQQMAQMRGGMFGQGGMQKPLPPGMMGGIGQLFNGGGSSATQQGQTQMIMDGQYRPQPMEMGRGFPGGPPLSYPNPFGGAPDGMNYTGGSRDFDETRGGGFNRYPPQIDPNTGYPVGALVSKPIGPGDGPFGFGGNRPGTQGPGDGGAPRRPGGPPIDPNTGYPVGAVIERPRFGTQGPGDGLAPPPRRGPDGVGDGINTTMPLPRRGDGVGDGTGPGGMGFGRGDMPPLGRDRPTKGPIDGRKLRDMMDITKRREMDFDLKNRRGGGLPGSARDGIPPSLNRPSRPTK